MADQVADTLRMMILVGDLLPGERVTQDDLSKRLGVSTMPVREALLRLAAEGFVEAAPNRSFRVVHTTREDIRDIYWIHAKLAGELTARACQAADARVLDALRECHDEYLAAVEAGDTTWMEEANWRFHKTINSAAGSPKLLLVLRSSLRFIPEGFYGLVRDWPEVSNQGHREILDAFENRNARAAHRAAEAHVRDAGELLISLFSSTGYWTPPEGSVRE